MTPREIGIKTTFKMSRMSASACTGMMPDERVTKISGVKKGAKRVLMLVTVTDRAISPLEMKVIMLEVVALGQAPSNIRPAAREGERSSTLVNPRANKGIIR